MKDSRKDTRRRYSAEFKTQILGECSQPAASVAGVALSHGINANIVHKWRRLAHAGTEAALARVVHVFGSARPHHAYLFANRRANRMKVLVHDGIGVWLAARRLNQGKFIWPKDAGATLTLTRAQLDALVLGLPWQRIGEAGVITVL